MTLLLLLTAIALVLVVASAAGRVPLWAGVFVGLVAQLVQVWGAR